MSSTNEAFALLSKALSYPDEETAKHVQALIGMFPDYMERLMELKAMLGDLLKAQELYVRTFDMREETTLNLAFYYFGYTRRLGEELVKIKLVMLRNGMNAEGESPDHLPLILELASSSPDGVALLGRYRQAVALIAKRLGNERNPYGALFEVLLRLIPEAKDEMKVKERPELEEVGLQ